MNKVIVYWLLNCCNVLMCIGLSVITPFFPPYAMQRGLAQQTVGFIVSANPLGAFFTSLLLGRVLNEKNRFHFMMCGLMMQSTGMFGFGLNKFIEDNDIFVVAATCCRIMTSCFVTSYYAYIPLIFPTEVEKYIAMAELASGLGFLIGPIVGSLLYQLGGYVTPFFVFATVTLVFSPLICVLIKNPIDPIHVPCHNAPLVLEQIPTPPKKKLLKFSIEQNLGLVESSVVLNRYSVEGIRLGICGVLTEYIIFINFIVIIAVNFVMMYFAPILSEYLQQNYGASPGNVGVMMSVFALTYSAGTIIVILIKQHKQYYIYFGLVICALCFFYVGPDKYFSGLDADLIIVLAAQGVMGFSVSFVFILTLPLINELLLERNPEQPLKCANIASALFNSGMAVGELLGPLVSGIVTQRYGFGRGCSFVGFGLLLLCVCYIPVLFHRIRH